MILFLIIVNILILLLFFVGIGFIVGALKRMPVLFKLPDSSWMLWLKFLQKISDKCLMMYYLAVGLVFIIMAIALAIEINR
jgi:hypothetical protein